MKIQSKTLGIIIGIVLFGGIMGASALGLWKTTSDRNSNDFQLNQSMGETAGENAETGAYLPVDIRGNHRFDEISEIFDIPLETLSHAFALPADIDTASVRSQDFETLYPAFEGEQELGNGSLKWFVALYTGLPFELEDDEEDTYLLRPAVEILKSQADLTTEQIAYLDAYTIEIEYEFEPTENNQSEDEPQTSYETETVERKQDELTVARKTIFADLLDWGVPVDQIEIIIGGEIPNRLVLVYDYCIENGLSFGTIKTELQAEVDKLD